MHTTSLSRMRMTATEAGTPSGSDRGQACRGICGYTLVEALATMVIVLLITMGVATGIGFAQRQFGASMTTSESKVLYSTLENAIRNEICYADMVVYDGSDVRFTSLNYSREEGSDPTWRIVAVDGDGNLSTDGRGEIALYRDGEGGGSIIERLLAGTAYTRGMTASVSTARDADDDRLVYVDLTIYDGHGQVAVTGEFVVKTVNTTVATL